MSDPVALARSKRSRTGHRASVSKTIQKVEDELRDNPTPNKQKLKHYQQTLQQKLQTLEAIDEFILEQVEEDKLEEEIEGIDDVNEKIGLCLLTIEDSLSQLETAKPPTITPIEAGADAREETGTKAADVTPPPAAPERIHTPDLAERRRIPTPHTPKVKLPKLSIKKFDGDHSMDVSSSLHYSC